MYARDSLSNFNFRPITILVDGTDPQVEITAPESNQVLGTSFNFQFSATDNIQVDEVLYCISDTSGCSPNITATGTGPNYNSGNIDLTGFDDGIYFINALARDLAGNEDDAVEVQFEVDNTPPQINLVSPPQMSIINGTAQIVVEIIDLNLNLGQISLENSAGVTTSYSQAGNEFTFTINTLSDLDDGENTFIIRAQDTASTPNLAQLNLDYIVNNNPPIIIEIIEPSANERLTGIFNMTARIIDEATSVVTANSKCQLSGVDFSMTEVVGEVDTFRCQIDSSLVPDSADATLTIFAQDESGNEAEQSISIYVDNTPPEATSITLSDIFTFAGKQLQITATDVTDPTFGSAGIAGCEAYYSSSSTLNLATAEMIGTLNTQCLGNIQVPLTAQHSEDKYIFILFEDQVGLTGNASIQIVVDNIDPVLTNLLFNGSITTYVNQNALIEFEVIAQDDDGLVTEIQRVYVSSRDSSSEVNLTRFGVTDIFRGVSTANNIGCPSDDICEVIVYAVDEAGNIGNISANITVDSTPPVIHDIILSDDYVQSPSTINITVLLEDNPINVELVEAENIELFYDGQNGIYYQWSGLVEVSDVAGNRNINVSVVDPAGNMNSDSTPIIFDNIDPILSDLTYSDLDNISNSRDSFTFTVEVLDENNFEEPGQLESVILYGDDINTNVVMTDIGSNLYQVVTRFTDIGFDLTQNGNRTFNVRATDRAGNFETISYDFILNNIPPNLTGAYYYDQVGLEQFTVASWLVNPPDILTPSLPDFPFFRAVQEFNFSWEVNASDNVIGIQRVFMTSSCSNDEVEFDTITNNITYSITTTPLDLDCQVEGPSPFQDHFFNITAVDRANNTFTREFPMTIIEDIPILFETTSNISQVEMNYGSVNLTINMTILSGLKEGADSVRVTLNSSDENIVYNMSISDFSIDGAQNYIGYITHMPSSSGFYNVTVWAVNIYDATNQRLDVDVFESIPTTQGRINATITNTSLVENVSIYNNVSRFVTVSLENIQDVSMRNTEIEVRVPTGILTNLTNNRFNCGLIRAGEICEIDVEIIITPNAQDGIKTINTFGRWDNPDDLTGGNIRRDVQLNVAPNLMYELSNITISNSTNLTFTKEELLGQFRVVNVGNIPLQNVEFNIQGISSSWFTFNPSNIGLINTSNSQVVEVLINATSRGFYIGEIVTDLSNSLCSIQDCENNISFDISVYEYINLERINPINATQEILRELSQFTLIHRIESNLTNSLGIENYPYEFTLTPINTTYNQSQEFNSSVSQIGGMVENLIDLRFDSPGIYEFRMDIESDLPNFRVALINQSIVNLTILGELTLSTLRTQNLGPISFYDTQEPYNTTFVSTLIDENMNPVVDGLVEFYSNATPSLSLEKIGECITNSSGECEFVFNPNVATLGNFTVISNATQQFFINSNQQQSIVEVEGDFDVVIINPNSITRYYRNETGTLEVVIQENGLEIDYSSDLDYLRWYYDGSIISDAQQRARVNTFNINSSIYERGNQNFSLELQFTSSGPYLFISTGAQIWDKVDLNSINTNTTVTQRNDSQIMLNASIISQVDSLGVENYTCSWYNRFNSVEFLINQTLTDSFGNCEVIIRVDNLYSVGENQFIVRIEEDSRFYEPIINELVQNITIIEELEVEIISPQENDIYYRGNSLELFANVSDVYTQNISTFSLWNISGPHFEDVIFTGIDLGVSNPFVYNIANNFTLGEYGVSLTSTKDNYISSNQTNFIEIRSYSRIQTIDSSLQTTLNRFENLEVSCLVIDQITSEELENYLVTFTLFSNNGTQLLSQVENTSNTGFAQSTFNLSNSTVFELGEYTLECSIQDMLSMYYESNGGNNDNNVSQIEFNLTELTNLNINLSNEVVYRDETENRAISENRNFSTIITPQLIAQTSFVENATLSLVYIDNLNFTSVLPQTIISTCTTNSSGQCEFEFNPNTSFERGVQQFRIISDKEFYNQTTLDFIISIFVPVEPIWRSPMNNIVIDFPNNELVDTMCEIIETDSGRFTLESTQNMFVQSRYPVFTPTLELRGNNETRVSSQNRTISVINEPQVSIPSNINIENNTIFISGNNSVSYNLENLRYQYDNLEFNITNISNMNYNVVLVNDLVTVLNISNPPVNQSINLSGIIFNQIQIETSSLSPNSSLNINELTLSRNQDIYSVILGDFEIFYSSQTIDSSMYGDMENLPLNLSQEDEFDVNYGLVNGWHVLGSNGTRSNFTVPLSGNSHSLEVISSLNQSEEFRVRFKVAGGSFSLDNFDVLGFFLNENSSQLNISLELFDGILSQTWNFGTYNNNLEPFNSLNGFREFQIELDNITTIDLSNIIYLDIIIENEGTNEVSTQVNLDNVYTLQNPISINGNSEFSWNAPRNGYYKVSCLIEDFEYYYTSENIDEVIIRLFDINDEDAQDDADLDLGEDEDRQDSNSAVTAFSVNIDEIDVFAIRNSVYEIDTLSIFNERLTSLELDVSVKLTHINSVNIEEELLNENLSLENYLFGFTTSNLGTLTNSTSLLLDSFTQEEIVFATSMLNSTIENQFVNYSQINSTQDIDNVTGVIEISVNGGGDKYIIPLNVRFIDYNFEFNSINSMPTISNANGGDEILVEYTSIINSSMYNLELSNNVEFYITNVQLYEELLPYELLNNKNSQLFGCTNSQDEFENVTQLFTTSCNLPLVPFNPITVELVGLLSISDLEFNSTKVVGSKVVNVSNIIEYQDIMPPRIHSTTVGIENGTINRTVISNISDNINVVNSIVYYGPALQVSRDIITQTIQINSNSLTTQNITIDVGSLESIIYNSKFGFEFIVEDLVIPVNITYEEVLENESISSNNYSQISISVENFELFKNSNLGLINSFINTNSINQSSNDEIYYVEVPLNSRFIDAGFRITGFNNSQIFRDINSISIINSDSNSIQFVVSDTQNLGVYLFNYSIQNQTFELLSFIENRVENLELDSIRNIISLNNLLFMRSNSASLEILSLNSNDYSSEIELLSSYLNPTLGRVFDVATLNSNYYLLTPNSDSIEVVEINTINGNINPIQVVDTVQPIRFISIFNESVVGFDIINREVIMFKNNITTGLLEFNSTIEFDENLNSTSISQIEVVNLFGEELIVIQDHIRGELIISNLTQDSLEVLGRIEIKSLLLNESFISNDRVRLRGFGITNIDNTTSIVVSTQDEVFMLEFENSTQISQLISSNDSNWNVVNFKEFGSFFPRNVLVDIGLDSREGPLLTIINAEILESQISNSSYRVGFENSLNRYIRRNCAVNYPEFRSYFDYSNKFVNLNMNNPILNTDLVETCIVPIRISFEGAGSVGVENLALRYNLNFTSRNIAPLVFDSVYNVGEIEVNINSSGNISLETNLEFRILDSHQSTQLIENSTQNYSGIISNLTQNGAHVAVIVANDSSGLRSIQSSSFEVGSLIELRSRFAQNNSQVRVNSTIQTSSGAQLEVDENTNTIKAITFEDEELNSIIISENTPYDLVFNVESLSTPTKTNVQIEYSEVIFNPEFNNATNISEVINPIQFVSVPLQSLNLPLDRIVLPRNLGDSSEFEGAFAAISVTTNVSSFSSVQLTFNYSDILTNDLNGYEYNLDNFIIMRCASDNASSCESQDWEKIESFENFAEIFRIRGISNSTSTFIVVEEDLDSTEDEVTPPTPPPSSGGGGGGGGGASSPAPPIEEEDSTVEEVQEDDETSVGQEDEDIDTGRDNETQIIDSTSAVCGNNICEPGQNPFTCPQDCYVVNYEVDIGVLDFVSIPRGDEVRAVITITSRQQEQIPLELSLNGGILEFTEFESINLTLNSFERVEIPVWIRIPQNAQTQSMSHRIVVKPQNYLEQELPGVLRILDNSDFIFNIDIDMSSNRIQRDESINALINLENEWVNNEEIIIRYSLTPFNVSTNELEALNQSFIEEIRTIMFTNPTSVNMTLRVQDLLENLLKDLELEINNSNVEGNSKLEVLNTYISNRGFVDALISRNASREDMLLNEGEYLLRVEAEYRGVVSSASTLVSIKNPFYKSTWFAVTLSILLLLLIAGVVGYGVYTYIAKKKATSRYIVPKLSDLPGRETDTILFNVGIVAGTKSRKAFIDSKDLNTHALVAGSTGSGKSVSASILVEEALNNKIPVVVFDPTSQWTGFLSALKDKNILEYYPKFGLSADSARSYRGLIFTPKTSDFELDFDEYLKPGEITVFNLAHLSTQDYDEATAKIIKSIFNKGWEESPDLKLLCVFDEVHRLLDPTCEGKGYGALTKGAREFRKWGIGLIMASQVSSDFKAAIGGNVLTEIQLNTKNLEDINKAEEKYGVEYAQRITRQGLGVAMVQNPKYNSGKPWFINFRPPLHNPHKLSDEDLDKYETFTTSLKKIKLIIKEMKSRGIDVNDYELDYNLANNKLKEGKFKMVQLYMEELENNLSLNSQYKSIKTKIEER
ncbi:MAG: DUF87 domain-containing protein, partial [Nanoarchaeota archaeon]|nr:DUF87 domain-containing protein [Nanoarchaeota archaeon]